MACAACLVFLVSIVGGPRKNTLVVGTKQGNLAMRAVRAAYYVCFCFVPATSALFEVDVSQSNMF